MWLLVVQCLGECVHNLGVHYIVYFLFPFFYQGVHPSIRGEVWEFLLGCFDPVSTYEEREQLRLKRRWVYDESACLYMIPSLIIFSVLKTNLVVF